MTDGARPAGWRGARAMSGDGKIAFRMQLNPGQAAAYKARHDAIWPELTALLRASGIGDYSIFLHEPTQSLFAVMRRAPDHRADHLPEEAVMRRWWRHMADIMATDATGAPLAEPLPLMFHMD